MLNLWNNTWFKYNNNTMEIQCIYEDKIMSFQDLKKSRSGFDTLQASLEKTSGGTETKSYNDDRYWKIDLDKTGNGYAVVRFLPASQGEDMVLGSILRPWFSRG